MKDEGKILIINKRLISTVSDSKKYIAGNVAVQWLSMVSNMAMIFSIGFMLEKLAEKNFESGVTLTIVTAVAALLVRFVCSGLQAKFSYLSSKAVKKTLREMICQKLLRLGSSYKEQVSTSEVVQVAVEGVDQLETCFGAYLPQFFYAMLAPLTLFAVLSFISFRAAVVLLICVPIIPIAIIAVQKIAKQLLSKYWGQYSALGDTFLESLQGLTTLKIYQADEYKNEKMNEESEKFRKITMKVLTMQLNSITIMDLVAYGGAAVGAILAVCEYREGAISLGGCFAILMLSADFFLPMRQLGSFFHVAMNGMAASDKIFRLLDLPEPEQKNGNIDPENCDMTLNNLYFSYEENREVFHDVSMEFPKGSFTAIAGESGCGKSTIAAILIGRNKACSGTIRIGGMELSEISEESLMKNITYISHNSYLFKGTVRDNLQMGNPDADDTALWSVLEQTKLADFLRSEQGLNTQLTEAGGNFSGGQRQRLALARAILHDSPIYIFDEATSNIDVESENDIIEQIHALARTKTVLLISHRLANAVNADRIYVLEKGSVAEYGTHEELIHNSGTYAKLWNVQQELERVGRMGK